MICIIHPTDKCNLNCSYCHTRRGNNVMEQKTLYNAIDFVDNIINISNYENNTLEFHAAEPLMAPLGFYKCAEKYLDNINFKWQRTMCSNLTLVNKDWVSFFKKHNYNCSTSLDGDIFIHDYNRGQDVFNQVIQAMVLLRENKIRFGVICVLTEYSCNHWEELYPFFKMGGFSLKINPVIPNNFNDKCAETMIKLYDVWFEDGRTVNIDPFVEMTAFILGDTKQHKCYLPCGEHIFSVDVHGDVYPCSSFVCDEDYSKYCYGNVNTDGWKDIWYGEKRTDFLKFKNNITDECIKCPYRLYCSGGCTKDSVDIGNTTQKMASTCEIFKPLLDHISAKMEAVCV